jgi:hypothetical protein
MMESQKITEPQGGTVMEFNEDRQLDPIPAEPENTEQIDAVIHEDAVESVEETVEETAEETAWHGIGAGQQESVAAPAEPEPIPEPAPVY